MHNAIPSLTPDTADFVSRISNENAIARKTPQKILFSFLTDITSVKFMRLLKKYPAKAYACKKGGLSMKQGKRLLNRLPVLTDLPGEPFPGQPVVELLGDKHLSVRQYSCHCVSVGMKFGCICVNGASLELVHMSKDQLVISGRIDSITINRKDSV